MCSFDYRTCDVRCSPFLLPPMIVGMILWVGITDADHDSVDHEHVLEHVHSRCSRYWLHQPLQVAILWEVRISWRIISIFFVISIFWIKCTWKSATHFLPDILRIDANLKNHLHVFLFSASVVKFIHFGVTWMTGVLYRRRKVNNFFFSAICSNCWYKSTG